MNWIFSQQKSILKLVFAGYAGSKNQVRNRLKKQFVQVDLSRLIFQKLSTDQQRVRVFFPHSIIDGLQFTHPIRSKFKYLE